MRKPPRRHIDNVEIDARGASCRLKSRTRDGVTFEHRPRLNMDGTFGCTCEASRFGKTCWALRRFLEYWRRNGLASKCLAMQRRPASQLERTYALTQPTNEI